MKLLTVKVLTGIALLFSTPLHSQTSPAAASVALRSSAAAQINWMSWEEATELAKKDKRKMLVDVFTEGCKWCKQMESTTFQHPDIVRYINEHFYPVKLDAEQRKELVYRNKTYKFVRNGQTGYHELAAELLRGRLSFPALVFLDEDLIVIQSFVGYKTPLQLEQIASYFASDQYKVTPWSTYQRTYKPMILDEK